MRVSSNVPDFPEPLDLPLAPHAVDPSAARPCYLDGGSCRIPAEVDARITKPLVLGDGPDQLTILVTGYPARECAVCHAVFSDLTATAELEQRLTDRLRQGLPVLTIGYGELVADLAIPV